MRQQFCGKCGVMGHGTSECEVVNAPRPGVFNDPDNYPAITLSQPWAGLVWLAAWGWPGKTIESRTRRIHYRGPLVICAGLSNDIGASTLAYSRLVTPGFVPDCVFRVVCSARGVALAKFWVKECRPFALKDRSPAFFVPTVEEQAAEVKTGKPQRYAWEAHDIAALEPFKVRGGQGFFRVPRAQVDAAVLAHSIVGEGSK